MNVQRLDWTAIDLSDDQQLARLFYSDSDTRSSGDYECPDRVEAHQELKYKGVIKHQLWEEDMQAYPNRSFSYPSVLFSVPGLG